MKSIIAQNKKLMLDEDTGTLNLVVLSLINTEIFSEEAIDVPKPRPDIGAVFRVRLMVTDDDALSKTTVFDSL